jgi:hypothetical protein
MLLSIVLGNLLSTALAQAPSTCARGGPGTWACSEDSLMSSCPSGQLAEGMWVCDYPDCNTSSTPPPSGYNPCGKPAISALFCCDAPPFAAAAVAADADGDDVPSQQHVILSQGKGNNTTPACGHLGTATNCKDKQAVVGVCAGSSCSKNTGLCSTENDFILQCMDVPAVSIYTCLWAYMVESELDCNQGYLQGLCTSYPDYDSMRNGTACVLGFTVNRFGVNCCFETNSSSSSPAF